MNKYLKYISGFVAALALVAGIGYHAYKAHAYISQSINAVTPATYQLYDFFASTTNPINGSDATTTNATSTLGVGYFDPFGRFDNGNFNVPGAKAITFFFSNSGSAVSSSTFYVQVTPDGTNWYPFNSLLQNLSTSTYPGISVGSQTVVGTSTVIDTISGYNYSFQGVRCIVVAAGGSAVCKAAATF